MGWDNNGRYYTRSVREGTHIRREYVGSGYLGRLCAALDAHTQAERAAECRTLREWDAEGQALRDFYADVETILRAVLTAAGYHRHARGQWRKRRENNDMSNTTDMTDPDTRQARLDIVRVGMKGNKAQEARAIAVLRAYPDTCELRWGDPLDSLLDFVGPSSSLIMRQMIRNEYEADVKYIAGPDPSPLEKLLTERVVVCRMQITHYERDYVSRLRKTSTEGNGLSIALSEHCQKRMDSLNKRYVSAIKALAQVRRLQLPAVQVNISTEGFNPASGLRKARIALDTETELS